MGDEILVTVEDDRIGMTPEQLNHLKEELPDLEKKDTPESDCNVDRRIRLHHGEQYRID